MLNDNLIDFKTQDSFMEASNLNDWRQVDVLKFCSKEKRGYN